MPQDGRLEISSIKNQSFYEKFSAVSEILDIQSIRDIIHGYYGSGFR